MIPPRAEFGRWFAWLVIGNAAAVFLLPLVLPYPLAGIFILDALPLIVIAEAAAAVFALARAAGMGAPRPFGAAALFAAGALMLAYCNAWLWVACCASV